MSLKLDPATTALVLIDLQRGIVGMPTEPYPAQVVVARAAELAEACRAAGAPVLLVHVSAAPDGKDALRPEADEPLMRAGTLPEDWDQLVPEVGPKPGDLVITKRQWGAFYGTELDLELRRRGIRTIILGGIATNIGVESTARDAYERGYQQVFAEDAMAARSAEEHRYSCTRIFPRIGRVRPTGEIVAALRG
ncbi:putative enzyme of isochorismatase family [Candidatus Hydrogenisulfobacillus filiaventi]|uniref:Putative enzyme of isochorismatase family n=1 Tax=Candidatus Hydrogenisulfobacillus filiaventi TaxID=2707344 RepID=A0A6F8ZK59_9FIRM|nr:hydrolase [Bacillota bacterium]CAB1130056.1 putative enzyme of isochorismatase family [Candidatus Hydrogenisulfobacillus filiaventi]